MRIRTVAICWQLSRRIACSAHAPAAEPLEAGIAFVDITPPIPFRMSGYFYERLSTGHEGSAARPGHRLSARQGNGRPRVLRCRRRAARNRRAGPQESERRDWHSRRAHRRRRHAHAHGPAVLHVAARRVARAGHRKVRQRSVRQRDYRNELIDKIADAVAKAKAALAPVELKSGTAHEDRISFNRRFYMKDGSVRFNPPATKSRHRPPGRPDRSAGRHHLAVEARREAAIERDRLVRHAPRHDGRHAVLGRLCEVARGPAAKSVRPDFKLLFGTGTCGNINHRDVYTTEQRKADTLGTMLGDTVATAIEQGEVVSGSEPSLAARSVKVDAPLQTYTAEQIADAKAAMPRVGTRDMPFLEAVEACKIVDIERLKASGYPGQLEVQAFRLNRETAIVTLPSEIFVEIGLAIKAASPFKTTLVVELANDDLAYMPTKQAFAEGSYEITNSRVEPGTGEKLVEAAIKLLKELQ